MKIKKWEVVIIAASFLALLELISVEPEKQADEKIRMNLIIHSLGQTIETIKKDLPLKKVYQELMRKCGYVFKS